ncbi:MAG: L,D-transpeptidase [Chloroflexota bacterium]
MSLTSLASAPFTQAGSLNPDQQGRVIYDHISVYQQPSLTSDLIKQYWVDTILPITEVTIGDEEPAYNRVWYQIGNEGYAHSGGIQPVRTIPNQPAKDIPPGGQLAEVTVPYTDARWEPDLHKEVGYRFYYETTHWVIGLTFAPDGTPWYRILDDKWELILYVLARHIRLIPPSELSTISSDVPAAAKRIEVRTREQVVIAYEWDRPVFMSRTATGAKFSNGQYLTPGGRHDIYHKRPSRHMAAGNLAYNGFDLPGIPWVCYITESGIAFHGTYWHNDYGKPRSHGCINLPSQASKWIYRWSLPAIDPDQQSGYEKFGTRVDVI